MFVQWYACSILWRCHSSQNRCSSRGTISVFTVLILSDFLTFFQDCFGDVLYKFKEKFRGNFLNESLRIVTGGQAHWGQNTLLKVEPVDMQNSGCFEAIWKFEKVSSRTCMRYDLSSLLPSGMLHSFPGRDKSSCVKRHLLRNCYAYIAMIWDRNLDFVTSIQTSITICDTRECIAVNWTLRWWYTILLWCSWRWECQR